jgi:hypothetical protein
VDLNPGNLDQFSMDRWLSFAGHLDLFNWNIQSVKGINILTAFYMVESDYGTLRVPIDYQIVTKTKVEIDERSGKERRVSEKTKNEMMREMIERTIQKRVKFGYMQIRGFHRQKT